MSVETLEDLAGNELRIGGRTVVIKKLSTRQLLRILRLAASAYTRLGTDQQQALQSAAKDAAGEEGKSSGVGDAETQRRGLQMLFQVLDEDTVGDLLAIITREDKEWCLDGLALHDIALISEELSKQEQLSDVISAFRRVAKGWRPPSNN